MKPATAHKSAKPPKPANEINRFLFAFGLTLCSILLTPLPGSTEITDAPYLEREFDWAMFVDVQDGKDYLNYRGSLLHPLTKVRVHLQTFARLSGSSGVPEPAKMYDQLWYHKGMPIGSRRQCQLQIPKHHAGAIVISQASLEPDHALAAANASLRLILDLHFKQIHASTILVPKERYDLIVSGFEHYRFLRGISPVDGKQMSINLRSYPTGRDETFYLQK